MQHRAATGRPSRNNNIQSFLLVGPQRPHACWRFLLPIGLCILSSLARRPFWDHDFLMLLALTCPSPPDCPFAFIGVWWHGQGLEMGLQSFHWRCEGFPTAQIAVA